MADCQKKMYTKRQISSHDSLTFDKGPKSRYRYLPPVECQPRAALLCYHTHSRSQRYPYSSLLIPLDLLCITKETLMPTRLSSRSDRNATSPTAYKDPPQYTADPLDGYQLGYPRVSNSSSASLLSRRRRTSHADYSQQCHQHLQLLPPGCQPNPPSPSTSIFAPIPPPGASEIVVKIGAIAIDPIDWGGGFL